MFTLLGINGFSLYEWHRIIDPEYGADKRYKIDSILGSSRGIRSDDWIVNLPITLSQLKTGNKLDSPLWGVESHNTAIIPYVGSSNLHWSVFFRPFMWGYFYDGDFGLAWHWWSMVFGLLIAFSLCISELYNFSTRENIFLSVFIVGAPFFQFWSFNLAPMVIGALIGLWCALKITQYSYSIKKLTILSGLMFWALGIVAFAIYPPYQISLFWLCLACLLPMIFTRRKSLIDSKVHTTFLFAPMIFVALVLVCFYIEFRADIQIVLQTVFPGKRHIVGGARNFFEYFNSNFFVHWESDKWFINICESAGFFIFSPILYPLFYFIKREHKIQIPPWIWGIMLCQIIFLWHGVFGFPIGIRKLLLLDKVPDIRSGLTFGIADFFLLVWCYEKLQTSKLFKRSRVGLSLFAIMFSGVIGIQIFYAVPSFPVYLIVFGVFMQSCLYVSLIQSRMRVFKFLVLVYFLSASWFNPLHRNAYKYLTENPLALEVQKIQSQGKKEDRWLSFGPHAVHQFLRIQGVPVINGVHFYPQFEVWKHLDPNNSFRDIYNRYAHVEFTLQNEGDPKFEFVQLDYFRVHMSLSDKFFKDVNVRYVLLEKKFVPQDLGHFRILSHGARWSILERQN